MEDQELEQVNEETEGTQIEQTVSEEKEIKIIRMGQAPIYIKIETGDTLDSLNKKENLGVTVEQLMLNGQPVNTMEIALNDNDTIVIAPKVKGGN